MPNTTGWTDKIVSALESVLKIFLIALNALQTVLESIVQALEGIVTRFLRLIEVVLKVGFYVAPFVLMVVIGPIKHWVWMTISGWIIITLVLIIFTANLIGELRGKPSNADNRSPDNLWKLNLTIGVLNVSMLIYSTLYFGAGISLEKQILILFGQIEENPTASAVREEMYLRVLDQSTRTTPLHYQEAVKELGRLRSNRAVAALVNRLNSLNFKAEKVEAAVLSEALLIIDALQSIASAEACSTLVSVETTSTNPQLKEKARKAANIVCK